MASHDLVLALRELGWTVEENEIAVEPTLDPVAARRATPVILDLIRQVKFAASPDDKVWLLTAADYAPNSKAAFAWNEWEKMSLDSAGEGTEWANEVRRFWERHFPFLMSVRNGYAYLAVKRTTGVIVFGEEPEFEEAEEIAPSLKHLAADLSSGALRPRVRMSFF
jgi:hypothetical protein